MIDRSNPTDQFHPYEKPDTTPQSEMPSKSYGVNEMLRKAGFDSSKLSNIDTRQMVTKARDYARQNPGKVLGGLAAAVIGLGLLRGKK